MKLEILHQSAPKRHKHPLLFVHGMWHAAWCWEKYFMPFFAERGYDVYAVSLRNHGASDHPKATWRVRIKDYVTDVKQAVDSIDGDPILVGHSMGGFVVQKYLEKYDAPASVLLASVPPYGIIGPTMKVLKKIPLKFLLANVTLNLGHIVSNPKTAKHFLFLESMPDEVAAQYHARLENEAYLGYLDMLLLDRPKPKKMLAQKMLVLGAQQDKVIAPKDVHKTAKAYGAKVEILDSMAHDMMLDLNWQQAAESIIQWVGDV